MSDAAYEQRSLPVGGVGRIGVGWWGVLCVIATEGALFAYLLFSYFYYAVQLDSSWIPEPPSFRYSVPQVFVLILSSIALWWAERSVTRDRRPHLLYGLAIALLLGVVSLILQFVEWGSKSFTLRSGVYGSVFFTITGVHLAHLAVGLVALLMLVFWSLLGYFDSRRNAPVLVGAAYWHFVVAAGIAVFLTLYVTPYLG